MGSIYNEIMDEIQRLRQLKQSVFEEDYNHCDITASNICLSTDILLIPLYLYITLTLHKDIQPISVP